jgi:transposase InsO family protein
VIDCFSKHLWVKHLRTKEAQPIADWFTTTFSNNPFAHWQSDNGGEFIAAVVEDAIKAMGGNIIHSAPRHPQTNGQIERVNGTL